MQLLLGFLLGALIAILAWRVGALSTNGALAATLTGGLIFGLGGLSWAVLLLIFFVTSSTLSRTFARKKAVFNEKFAKGNRRDWGQVLANGGLGAGLALIFGFFPEQDWIWAAYAGAMAAVNADTWATELGVLNPTAPRLISNGRVVERGASGGVSLDGYLAALGGAAFVGLAAALFTPGEWQAVCLGAILGGLAGSSLDSWLGATVQAIYTCPVCQKETEKHPFHACGAPTQPLRGWRWFGNDLVNFACSLGGAFVSAVIWLLFS